MQKAKAQGKDNIDKWWLSRPWRQIQTNLSEIDMVDMNAERFVADLQEFKATSVFVNAAGIIASYPTKLPYHFQSPFLQGDSLEDIITACHKADITVIARTDFSKIRRPIYEEHPEWAYVSPNGKIVDYNGDVHVCINGDYQQVYAQEIIKELLTTLDFDGIFFNMGGFQVKDYSYNYFGICHCNACKTKFSARFGLDLPKAEDMNDPVFRKYVTFKREVMKAHDKKIHDLVQNIRPNILISNNRTQGAAYRQESNTEIGRPLPHWQYSASDNTKYVVSSYAPMVSLNTTVDFIGFPYRHVAVSPHQQALRLTQNLANGGGLDFYLMGRMDNRVDKSGFESVKNVFLYHAEHEDEYANLTSKATIGLINGLQAHQEEFRGWFRFLAESHYVFDTLMADVAAQLPWEKYKAIIVPDFQPISDELAKKLDEFAFNGGTVISVSRGGFCGDDYELRSEPALQCLGVNDFTLVRSDTTSSYLQLDHKELFPRFPVTDLLYVHGNYVCAEYDENVEKYFSLIPPHHFGPPERCYYTQITSNPGFTVHAYGKGKGIYIPWEPGALYHREGYTNTIDFISDLLQHVAGLTPVGGNLSPMVEATVFEKKDGSSQLLHLVNGSGHFGVSFFAPLSISDIEVSIPFTDQPSAVKSLVTGQAYDYSLQDDTLTIQIPRLELFEAVKISI